MTNKPTETTPGATPADNAVVETAQTRSRDVRVAFLVVGALIECGSIPLPNFKQEDWHQELSIAVLSVAAALAAAGATT